MAKCDARRLYLGEGCSSLFTFCTHVLHFSEHAAYHRIEGARAGRQFPIILKLIGEGAVTLTTVALLRPHLTLDNHKGLLAAAGHRTKREVEHQIACLAPKPDAKVHAADAQRPAAWNYTTSSRLREEVRRASRISCFDVGGTTASSVSRRSERHIH